jgi:hypothetical protein
MTIPKGSGGKRESGAYNHDADLLYSVSSIDLRYCDAALKWRHLTSMCTVHSLEKFSEMGRGTEIAQNPLTDGNAPEMGVTALRIADRALS